MLEDTRRRRAAASAPPEGPRADASWTAGRVPPGHTNPTGSAPTVSGVRVPLVVEVLRRYSNNYAVTQRVGRLTRHLAAQPDDVPPPRAPYQPHKLSQRLDAATVTAIL